MSIQLNFILGIILVLSTTAQGQLSLIKNKIKSCLGEEVIFTCTGIEGSRSLSWTLRVTRDSNIPALTHTFSSRHYAMQSQRMITRTHSGFHVELELVSIEPVIVTTLTTNLTNIIVDAEVTCRQFSPVSQQKIGHFNRASVPSAPVQITDIDYEYGCTNFNVSFRWAPPLGNHLIDSYRLRIIGGQSYSIAKDTSFTINSVSYFENITVEVAIVNCAGVGAEETFIITRGGCFELQTRNSSEDLCIRPTGYQRITECDYGQFPEEVLLTCNESGSWIPDTVGCSVGCYIPTFSLNNTVVILNNEMYTNALVNYTAMGSEIQLFCGSNETSQDGASSMMRAVCGENGTWSPDLLSGYKCGIHVHVDTGIHPMQPYIIHIIAGASTGCTMILLLVICGLICIIWRAQAKQGRHNERPHIQEPYPGLEFQYKLGELDEDMCDPQYDTISPIYEMMPESVHHSQNSLKMMNNDAYAETTKHAL